MKTSTLKYNLTVKGLVIVGLITFSFSSCGTVQDFWQAAWIDQQVSSDPVNAFQVRKRIKVFKALMGPDVAAYADHVELTAVDTTDDWKEIGRDFATAVGTGAVVGTKFTWPTTWERLDVLLTAKEEVRWTKLINLYREKMLSKGQYLNLYETSHTTSLKPMSSAKGIPSIMPSMQSDGLVKSG